MSNDEVHKALADSSRRQLLDSLFQQDGQTLIELSANLSMTRFGVMKHLRILEEAGLIATRKVGRNKFHYLNPVPIQEVYDRWISRFAKPFVSKMTDLKNKLEENKTVKKHKHVFEILIETTPEKLWQALTDGEMTKLYYFDTEVVSDWKVGGEMKYLSADGFNMISCNILEIDKPRKLVTTFQANWAPELPDSGVSKVTYEIEPQGNICKLSIIHDELDENHPLTQGIFEGWSRIISGLKTLLETGKPLFSTMKA